MQPHWQNHFSFCSAQDLLVWTHMDNLKSKLIRHANEVAIAYFITDLSALSDDYEGSSGASP